jgi:hypothetical protein
LRWWWVTADILLHYVLRQRRTGPWLSRPIRWKRAGAGVKFRQTTRCLAMLRCAEMLGKGLLFASCKICELPTG